MIKLKRAYEPATDDAGGCFPVCWVMARSVRTARRSSLTTSI
jgi:hypothetical protein